MCVSRPNTLSPEPWNLSQYQSLQSSSTGHGPYFIQPAKYIISSLGRSLCCVVEVTMHLPNQAPLLTGSMLHNTHKHCTNKLNLLEIVRGFTTNARSSLVVVHIFETSGVYIAHVSMSVQFPSCAEHQAQQLQPYYS